MEFSSVSKSYATGNVEGASNVGGFVGFMQYTSSVSESYSIGDVKGFNMIGGFVGSIYKSFISESYAVGNVSGDSNIGGFVGLGSMFDIFDSFYIGTPYSDDISLGIFVEPDELKQISTFRVPISAGGVVSESWNISSSPNPEFVWYIDEGNSYPQFFRDYIPPVNQLPELAPDSPQPTTSPKGNGFGKAEIVPPEFNAATKPDLIPESEIIASDSLIELEKSNTSVTSEKSKPNGMIVFLVGLFLIPGCVFFVLFRRRSEEDSN